MAYLGRLLEKGEGRERGEIGMGWRRDAEGGRR